MVWDWRSFHSLVPKVTSFGVGHEEERENTNYSQGGESWQRITASSVVVFEGGASPPSTPFLMPIHQGKDGQKKNPPPTSQKVDIFIPPWYTVYAEGRQGFSIDLWGLLYHFSLLRGLRVLYFPYLRVLWIFPPMFSYVSPYHPSAPFVKSQRHKRLTSAAFGDIIKLQNRYGGSLPKGR